MARRPAPQRQALLGAPGLDLLGGRPASACAGVDEAGRGCLAGPVVSAACILPDSFDLPGLTDSKALSAEKRETLATAIRAQAVAWSLGLAWPGEIDRVNILQASLRSMERAVARLRVVPQLLLVDGNQNIATHLPQRTVIGGDALVPAISAASILAKTFRDHLLAILDRLHPGYGLAVHKGYGTAVHLSALKDLGPSPVHRLSFRGVLPDSPASPHRNQERQPCLPGITTPGTST